MCARTNPHGAGKMDKMDQGKMDLSLDVLGCACSASRSRVRAAAARAPPARTVPLPARDAGRLCALALLQVVVRAKAAIWHLLD